MAYDYSENTIAELVKNMVQNIAEAAPGDGKKSDTKEHSYHEKAKVPKKNFLDASDYPIAEKHPELLKTQLGKAYDNVTLAGAMSGEVVNEDIRISPEVLEYQAQIAESTGKTQLAENFRRAAELAVIPDEIVLKIYNMLRPNRSSEKELLDLAMRLRNEFNAPGNALLVEEAAAIYKKRGILTDG